MVSRLDAIREVKEEQLSDVVAGVIERLFLDMAGGGWTVGALCDETEELDRYIFESLPCQRCDNEVQYYGFHKRVPRKYAVFTVCLTCGYLREH